MTSLAMLLPLAILLYERQDLRGSARRAAGMISAALMVAVLCHVPVYLKYGPGFLTFSDIRAYPSFERLMFLGYFRVWGGLSGAAWAMVGLALVHSMAKGRLAGQLRRQPKIVIAAGLVVVTYVAIFVRLPFEPAYLLPIVPFLLILIALLLPHPIPVLVSFVLASSAFVEVRGGQLRWTGPALQEFRDRIQAIRRVDATIAAMAGIPENAVIVAGWKLPQIRHALRLRAIADGRTWIYLVRDDDELAGYLAEKRPLYFLQKMDAYQKAVHGIDLRSAGALPYPGETAR